MHVPRDDSHDAIALTASREANTCDSEDYVIDEGTTHILFLVDDDKWGAKTIEGYDTKLVDIKGFNRVQVIKVNLISVNIFVLLVLLVSLSASRLSLVFFFDDFFVFFNLFLFPFILFCFCIFF